MPELPKATTHEEGWLKEKLDRLDKLENVMRETRRPDDYFTRVDAFERLHFRMHLAYVCKWEI